MVVKVEIALQRRKEIEAGGEIAGVDEFVLERAPQPFDETLSRARPRPSMLIKMPRS
jgi:hypothetical protein